MRHVLTGLVFLGLLPACGGGGSGAPTPPVTTPPPQRALVTVTFTPDPVVALPSGNPDFPFTATWTMTIREGAGLGANVNFWNETLFNPGSMLQGGTRNFGADQVILLAGSNRLQPNGTLTISRTSTYRPGGTTGTGRAVDVRVVVQLTDDRSNVLNVEATLRVI